MAGKKYYWLKLKKDFFKRHDMQILESFPNGKEYLLLFVKLMVESIDHDGLLRFSEAIPYTEDMIAVITNTDADIVHSALVIFRELGLVSVDADGTYEIPLVENKIGSAMDNDAANRQRRKRENDSVTKSHEDRDKMSQKCHADRDKKSLELEIELEIEKELDKKELIEKSAGLSPARSVKKKARFVPPTVEEVRQYCTERGNGIDADAFVSFYASKNWMVGRTKMADWKASVRTWESRRKTDKKSGAEVPYMEKEYSAEYFEKKEQDDLDALLNED